MTLKELSKLYFRSYKLRVKKSSYVNKKYIYFRSFKGYGDILDKEIRNIDADDLIALQEHLKKRYTNNVATVSYYSVINVFEFAKQIGEVKINVAKAVQSMRLKKVATPKNIITEENFYKMLHFINDIDEKIYLELIFVTGLRSAEARALTWENVSFEKSTLKVTQSIYCFTYKKYEITTPKTRSSERIINIDRTTLSLLQNLKDRNRFNSEQDFVFNEKGLPRPYSYSKSSREQACKKAGIKFTSIHNLRHSHATNMLLRGIPISIISRRLGHSKPSITEDIYIHLVPANEKVIIEQLQYRSRNALNV